MTQVENIYNEQWQVKMQTIVDRLASDTRAELEAQGHVLTGNLLQSIIGKVNVIPNLIEGLLYMEEYGAWIDAGIKPENIPFSGSEGQGGTSEYIQGLTTFFMLRGFSDEEALSKAFATAYTQKEQGMPTQGSFFNSSNGRRTGFLTDTITRIEGDLRQMIDAAAFSILDRAMVTVLEQWTERSAIIRLI